MMYKLDLIKKTFNFKYTLILFFSFLFLTVNPKISFAEDVFNLNEELGSLKKLVEWLNDLKPCFNNHNCNRAEDFNELRASFYRWESCMLEISARAGSCSINPEHNNSGERGDLISRFEHYKEKSLKQISDIADHNHFPDDLKKRGNEIVDRMKVDTNRSLDITTLPVFLDLQTRIFSISHLTYRKERLLKEMNDYCNFLQHFQSEYRKILNEMRIAYLIMLEIECTSK